MLQRRRRVATALLLTFCILVLYLWSRLEAVRVSLQWPTGASDYGYNVARVAGDGKLRHLLIPATEVSNETCKLLASSVILDYPEPVILGLPEKRTSEGISDGRARQLEERIFKLVVVLEYLESLPRSADQDLALVLDAFDVWLLLPPQLVELRYYRVLQENDAQLAARGILGFDSGGRAVGSNIVFGANQTCWPDDTRPYCSHVPDSPLRDPNSDTPAKEGTAAHAKWANPGVFMGPVEDLRELLRRSLKLSENGYRTDYEWRFDDQGAIQDVWAEQERARTWLAGGNATLKTPDIQHVSEFLRSAGGSVEHGITIDYEGLVVQQAWSSMHSIHWMTYDSIGEKLEDPPSDFNDLPLPSGGDTSQTWARTKIGVNSATKHAFPIFHMTAHKGFRWQLWPKMWFQKHGKTVLGQKSAKVVLWSRDGMRTERKTWEHICSQYKLFPD
ncbi:hypothetical protein CBER1_07748 [Cercospora berteroae]|uniref:Uncharacterized protein n=1 Tax=Cercospora berteroae TaxID=357750 RepID=A0A2S6C3V5_9PEZI|nr:hypothetical protein CBER1_07748 [Cercospora berteroae]